MEGFCGGRCLVAGLLCCSCFKLGTVTILVPTTIFMLISFGFCLPSLLLFMMLKDLHFPPQVDADTTLSVALHTSTLELGLSICNS